MGSLSFAILMLLSASRADPVETAFQRGAACLARADDGHGTFGDPYLEHVYPDDALPAPADMPRLTYRQVDALVMLAMLRRAGPLPPALDRMAANAGQTLRQAAPGWAGRGFTNTRARLRADGIALDTFCMVGWTVEDAAMAREVSEAIDGDRWLPPGWYDPPQAFRAAADEVWCLRLLQRAGKMEEGGRKVLDRLVARLSEGAAGPPDGIDAFYEAWHLGMLAAEGNEAVGLELVLRVFRAWAAAHDPARGEDILEWANLAASEALVRSGDAGGDLRRRAVQVILSGQQADGCWTIPGAAPPREAFAFLTLRALLALRLYLPAEPAGPAP